MGLNSTAVSRCLEKKLLFFGYELPDVLVIFIFLAALNLAFGRGTHKIALIWFPAVLLAVAVRLIKRGKPDNFIVHWIRFRIRSKSLCAFPEPTIRPKPPTTAKKGLTV